MKTISKIIVGIILVAVIIAIGTFAYIYTSLDALVETAIEKYGSQTTQTAVVVDKVKIELTDGKGAIAGIRIANPKGFSEPDIFTLGQISTRIDVKSITRQPIIIEEVRVNSPVIYYEMDKDRQDNLSVLKKSITSQLPQKKTTSAKEKEEKESRASDSEPKFMIRRFIMDKAKLKATIIPLEGRVLQTELPRIELKNVGGKGGSTAAELAEQLLQQVVDKSRKAVANLDIEKQLKKEVESKLKSEAQKQIDEQLGPDQQEAKDALKQLLGQ